MLLADKVSVARRFQRSIRIDSDHDDLAALKGYICPQSSADVLLAVGNHVSETGHGSFTWTGPYGSGKSSLVVALSALLSGDQKLRKEAETAIGAHTTRQVLKDLPVNAKGWLTLAVVGRRENPAVVIGEAVIAAGGKALKPKGPWTDAKVVDALVALSNRDTENEGGVLLVADEMGKFLEHAAHEGGDVYLFQLLAEAASRSNGRLIVIGVLHQAFEEYANRLSRQMRDEWAKIQGRYIDLPVNAAGEEQIELISRAIESERKPDKPGKASIAVARDIHRGKSQNHLTLANMFEACWPLHPVSTCSLVAIARRRFGQNQRSIFGFLNSAEHHGFQDFINNNKDETIYVPDLMWDYLRVNLEPSILASADGHRWSVAIEAIDRCESFGGDTIHVRLLKTIALIDMFKDRSGLAPTGPLLKICLHGTSAASIKSALDQLAKWSLIIYRKFSSAYAIYAGSDFDIDQALRDALQNAQELDFELLQRSAGLQPVLAKRHYHRVGALRWFDLHVVPVSGLIERVEAFEPQGDAIGQFLLAVPTDQESPAQALDTCRQAAAQSVEGCVAAGLSERAWKIIDVAREITAIEQIQEDRPELAGDMVAQRELETRQAGLQGQLEEELRRAVDDAKWCFRDEAPRKLGFAELSGTASSHADKLYNQAPHFNSELMNRIRPSNNAVGARNLLIKAMLLNGGAPQLGIKGFPAERGVYSSLLEETGLYRKVGSNWKFCKPTQKVDRAGLYRLWEETQRHLKENSNSIVSIDDLYKLWSRKPFGVKEGVMPVIAVAFILTMRDQLAIYREQVFQARFSEIDAEFLARDAADIQLRWVEASTASNDLLGGLSQVVQSLGKNGGGETPNSLDVARGLVSVFDGLQPWTRRTSHLTALAIRIRDVLKVASDPNKLLYEDIPSACRLESKAKNGAGTKSVVEVVRQGLGELVHAHDAMLSELKSLMLGELQVADLSGQSLSKLRGRAKNIQDIKGDFRLTAFIGRIATFEDRKQDIEGIASLVANKPPRDWVDADIDLAKVEIVSFAQKFIRLENFARVKGRPDKRQSIAVVVGLNGKPEPVHAEFEVSEDERVEIEKVVARIETAIDKGSDGNERIRLAAIAEVSSRYASRMNGQDVKPVNLRQ